MASHFKRRLRSLSKEIVVRGGYTTTVSDEDYEELSRLKWSAVKVKGRVYVAHIPKPIYMHRVVTKTTAPVVDHADGNTLNNTRENLRPATYSQNAANAVWTKRTPSGLRGVAPSRGGVWRAALGGKFLGLFWAKETAAMAYDNVAREKYGQFARLNFPYWTADPIGLSMLRLHRKPGSKPRALRA